MATMSKAGSACLNARRYAYMEKKSGLATLRIWDVRMPDTVVASLEGSNRPLEAVLALRADLPILAAKATVISAREDSKLLLKPRIGRRKVVG